MTNVTFGIIQVIKDVATGRIKLANKATSKQRMATCNGCEAHSKFKTCTVCGCLTPIKVRLQESVCPMGLW